MYALPMMKMAWLSGWRLTCFIPIAMIGGTFESIVGYTVVIYVLAIVVFKMKMSGDKA